VPERFTLDTNVLVYAFDRHEPLKQAQAQDILRIAPSAECTLTAIALGEFHWVATHKLRLTNADAEAAVRYLATLFPVCEYGVGHVVTAAGEASAGRFSLWDAVLLSAAADAGCTVCLSEDMKDGAKLGAITVRNPFGPKGLSKAARELLKA
jgi:predicted nucleic acid-binding protein